MPRVVSLTVSKSRFLETVLEPKRVLRYGSSLDDSDSAISDERSAIQPFRTRLRGSARLVAWSAGQLTHCCDGELAVLLLVGTATVIQGAQQHDEALLLLHTRMYTSAVDEVSGHQQRVW